MQISVFESFFKPETRNSGAKLIEQEKVSLSGGTDSGVQSYVQATPPVRVRLSSLGITSEEIRVDCSCSAGKKNQLCKHAWATLVLGVEKYPDFFHSKRTLAVEAAAPDTHSAKQDAYRESAKKKASDYRKAEYQRQKTLAKERKTGKSSNPVASASHPPQVEAAFAYFELNGFPLANDLSEDSIGKAKRQLSRIFHPDRGGSHDEVTELNAHCEVLVFYLRA